jgi:hypothetical protein
MRPTGAEPLYDPLRSAILSPCVVGFAPAKLFLIEALSGRDFLLIG